MQYSQLPQLTSPTQYLVQEMHTDTTAYTCTVTISLPMPVLQVLADALGSSHPEAICSQSAGSRQWPLLICLTSAQVSELA